MRFLKHVIFGGIFIIPLIVLFVDGSQLFPYVTGRNFLFRAIVEVIFFLWIGLAFFDEKYRPRKSILLASLTVFIGVILVADIFGLDPGKSFWSNFERMDGFVTLAHLLAYFLVIGNMLRDKVVWIKFWNVSIGTSIIVGLYAMVQLLRSYLVKNLGYGSDQGLAKILPIINQGGDRIDATFGNATYLAVYMLFHIFLTTLMLLKFKTLTFKARAYYITALVLQLISIYFTATRGAVLGLILGAVITVAILYFAERDNIFIKRIAVIAVIVAIVFGGFISLIKNTDFLKSQKTLNRLTSISLEDPTVKARFLMWGVATRGFLDRPVLGYGQDNYSHVFSKYYDPSLYEQEQWFDRAHNFIFDWLIAGGVIGLLAYMFIYFFFYKLLWKSDKFSLREKAVLSGLIAAYIFQNLFVFDQITSYMLFVSVLAYVYSITSEKKLFEGLFNKRSNVVLSLAVILAVSMPFLINARPYKQSTTTIDAINIPSARTQQELEDNLIKSRQDFEKAISYGSLGTTEVRENLLSVTLKVIESPASDETKNMFIYLTKNEFDKQVKAYPEDVRSLIIYGSFLSRFGLANEALEYLERAKELAPRRQNVHFELAQAYNYLGLKEEMVEVAKEGYELEEGSDEAWSVYVLSVKFARKDDLYHSLMEEAFNSGEYRRMIRVLVAEISNNPKDLSAMVNLAAIYLLVNQRDLALEVLEQHPDEFGSYIEAVKSGGNPFTK